MVLPGRGRAFTSKRWHGLIIGSKGQDTGILDGPNVRYVIPEAEGWRTSETWLVPVAIYQSYALRTDGVLGEYEDDSGSRTYMNLGVVSTVRVQAKPTLHHSWSGRLRR